MIYKREKKTVSFILLSKLNVKFSKISITVPRHQSYNFNLTNPRVFHTENFFDLNFLIHFKHSNEEVGENWVLYIDNDQLTG